MPYLGNAPSATFQSVAYQDLTGGTGTSFTLSHAVSSAQEIEVFVNNVRQEPTVAYTVAGTALTMTGTIAATDDFYVVFQGKAVGSVSHPTTSPLAATTGTFSGAVTATSFSGDGSALTGISAGKVLNVESVYSNTAVTTTSIIPSDSSVPLVSEGGEILSLSFTPTSATSDLFIFVHAFGNEDSNVADNIAVPLFKGSTHLQTGYISARSGPGDSGLAWGQCSYVCKHSPASTSAQTYSVRIGLNAAGTCESLGTSTTINNSTYSSTVYNSMVIYEVE